MRGNMGLSKALGAVLVLLTLFSAAAGTTEPSPTTATPSPTPVPTTATPSPTPVPTTATPSPTPVPTTATPSPTPVPTTATPSPTPVPTTATSSPTPVPTTAAPTPAPTPAPTTPGPSMPGPTAEPTPVLKGPCIPNPSQFTGRSISSLPCQAVKIDLPFALRFDGSQRGLPDKNNVSTGMRMFVPATAKGKAYNAKKLIVETAENRLNYNGLNGSWAKTKNNVRNALGVALPVPGNAVKLQVTVTMPDTDSGNKEMFCVFTAVSDLEFLSLCVQRHGSGYRLVLYYEVEDQKVENYKTGITLGASREITLQMDIYPADAEIDTFYKVAGGNRMRMKRVSVNPLTLNADQAGTDPTLQSRTNGGFYGVSSSGKPQVNFYVTSFTADMIVPPVDAGSLISNVNFDSWRVTGIVEPTSMAWAGGILWVTNVLGKVYALEFDADRTALVSRRELSPIGERMVLGLVADPDYANNQCLWLAHSSPTLYEGEANSGEVTRVCGPNLTQKTKWIWGLPRAKANHGLNGMVFKGNKMYLAVGGNTASGAPNLHEGFAFGTRPEQRHSAAVLEADVYAPGFRGDCTPAQNSAQLDASGIAEKVDPDCDVRVYASGLRNVFACVFHSNGHMYCPDNAIGGRGTFPDLPDDYQFGDSCDGIIDGEGLTTNDPGIREDPLFLVEEGGYYGHPNPSMNKCVMMAGNPTSEKDSRVPTMPVNDHKTYEMEVPEYPTGTMPDPDYRLPIAMFGKNRSPDAIIEYQSNKMCGNLKGQLLITWFSVEPQVRRIKLENDGRGVANDGTLRGTSLATGGTTLDRPLTIMEDDEGNLFVGEFGSNTVAVFNPKATGCGRRTASATAPSSLESAASATAGKRMFTFGGRRDGDVVNEAFQYDSERDTWTRLPELPEPLAEAGAIATADGTIMIIGGVRKDGSTSPQVWTFHPATGEYRTHSTLPEGRAGAVVSLHNDMPVVVGGITAQGELAADNTLRLFRDSWEATAPMNEGRAYAAGAVNIHGNLLVCGGLVAGQQPSSSCEQFDGSQWHSVAPMKTARSHHAAFSVGSRVVIKGGHLENGTLDDAIEGLDARAGSWSTLGNMRTARSRAITATIDGEIYMFSGRTEFDATRNGDIVSVS